MSIAVRRPFERPTSKSMNTWIIRDTLVVLWPYAMAIHPEQLVVGLLVVTLAASCGTTTKSRQGEKRASHSGP